MGKINESSDREKEWKGFEKCPPTKPLPFDRRIIVIFRTFAHFDENHLRQTFVQMERLSSASLTMTTIVSTQEREGETKDFVSDLNYFL